MVGLYIAKVKGDKNLFQTLYVENLSKQRRLGFHNILFVFSTAVHFPKVECGCIDFLILIDM